jgi:hypothetical protein
MKAKHLVRSLAVAAALTGLFGSAHAVSIVGTYYLPTPDFKILTAPSATPTYYELITVGGSNTTFTLEGAFFGTGSNGTYEIYKDDIAGAGVADFSTAAVFSGTGVADDNPDFFFTFMLNPGEYVLSILNDQPLNSTLTNVSSVPLPGAIWLFGSALLGFFGFSSRRKA